MPKSKEFIIDDRVTTSEHQHPWVKPETLEVIIKAHLPPEVKAELPKIANPNGCVPVETVRRLVSEYTDMG